ncbi:MAG: 2-C-methyl-D-erythritol 4-phosphate cytidylyltransferase [Prevotella sp.]|jgi:2-C-methyl-D-erythritol 4-phosphate cytidylyltransferase|nr:2-C-methyl-D-erythritol 4-phosphate cytidylyltransferase [Prevotella sp.]
MNIIIILSGGIGTRLGANIPKQYIEVNGKPIIYYSIMTFAKRDDVDMFIIGADEKWRYYIAKEMKEVHQSVCYSEPGETRQLSVFNALKKASEVGVNNEDIVIIHDAARPLVTNDIINQCIDGIRKDHYDGVLPVIHMKDTIYLSKNGKDINQLLNRNQLFAGQAPESFLFGKYLSIHESMPIEQVSAIKGSTEIAYKGGMKIKLAEGSEMNFKITTLEDLVNFKSIIEGKK